MSFAIVEAKMAVFGYARVSTDVQSLASQDAQLPLPVARRCTLRR